MFVNYLFVTVNAFLLSALIVFSLKKILSRRDILKIKNISLVGGIGIGLSFVVVSLTVIFLKNTIISQKIIGIIISSLLMLIFGIVDDCKELSVAAKFSTQIIATTLLVIFGVRAEIVCIGFFGNLIITYSWVLAITNAFNHLDILDGLAAVVAILVTLSFAVIAHLNNQGLIVIVFLILTASTLGFLIFNFPSARVYMGNSGSHFLGFTMAVIALLVNFAPMERKIALFTPLLILGFPIFDTSFLILMRLKNGRVIFNKSDDHLALRLLKSGFSKKKTLWLMFLLGLFFSLAGIIVSQASNRFGAVIVIFVVLFSLFIIRRMSNVVIDG